MSEEDYSDLLPIERNFLEKKGFILSKDVFGRDICSRQPYRRDEFNQALSMVSREFGYRDAHDRGFQKAREAYSKLTENMEYFI
jgi:hypothetical protein